MSTHKEGVVGTDIIRYEKRIGLCIVFLQYKMEIPDDIKTRIKWDSETESYKKRLTKLYRKFKHKTYDFKTGEEEDAYFLQASGEEEIYYYTFVIEWKPVDLKGMTSWDYLKSQFRT